jgi:UDP-2-acetamido-2-deoxy-ribo-hexuluronate aminotransferase
MIPFIDLKTQYHALESLIRSRIDRVLAHGQYVMGPEVAELEERLASFVGAKHCISASSGTDTLLIAMMALGIGPGDEVVTTPFTFISTGEMIALLGAKPVFVDIDPKTYNIDPAKVEAAITSRTKVIMPVSLYGQPADMDRINSVAARFGLPVIEDAAQSFGSTYKGKRSCALSTIGSTSFFPSKPLGAYGDGGALFTDCDDLAKVMREIRAHGQERRYQHTRIGINGRLDTVQAAILLAKLERFDEEVERRKELGAAYTRLIKAECPSVITPHIEQHASSVYAQYTIQVDNRDEVGARLKAACIPTAVHYPTPLHLQQALSPFGYRKGDMPFAEEAASRVISLPMGPDLSEVDQRLVVEVLAKVISNTKATE